MAKRLTTTERFLLENQGERFNSYRCAVHGVFQVPKTMELRGVCAFSTCTQPVEHITNPAEYLKHN